MNPLTFIRVLGREPWNVARCSSLGCSGDRSYWSLSTANVLLRFSSERCLECLVSSCRGAENPTYVEPSVRPDDSRYGDNPNRLQRHTQFKILVRLWALQGILKESHSLFAMFHGPIRTLLDRQPSAEFARGHLHTSQC
ncbi:vacuolar fusion protein CCZ1 [Hordeum vulgare]|nr:vacuolar fusion protein CCZ1 [Hordeum vulgare]